ncbi:hypothetical protein HDU98_004957, partial [Podochytrium sp. JEL0797]
MPLGTPTPIRRINLCCNSLGDTGLDILLDGLVEEIGMLAIDLQFNEITDAGGRIVEQVVRLNGELVIVDLRNNRIDPVLLRIIHSLLQVNMSRRLKAGEMPIHANGQMKMSQPQPIEWLSESHPLESTFHSTSTTSTSNLPYEHVRSSIRNANVLSHLRRHTSSSIKKINFASTKEAEAELRRKRRKWEEVEAAAKIKIPKGNLYPQNKSRSHNSSGVKIKSSSYTAPPLPTPHAKIPGSAWSHTPHQSENADVDIDIISHKLDSLFNDRKQKSKKPEYETSREAQLWAENQALKQR